MSKRNRFAVISSLSITLGLGLAISTWAEDPPMDSLYREIQRTVAEADFAGMAATYHPDAIVVTTDVAHPVADVIARWKAEGEAFKHAGGEATVEFRFSDRLRGATTAFDTGIFRYRAVDGDGKEDVYYTHFENLAILKGAQWRTMMERQTGTASEAEWQELPAWPLGDQ